ncbi:MAG: tRNA pseudouridine(55) synthase TruB [Lachnospiraceae bacterium]|nr:tRNA pseudouridine(55) synthase TruB [Lachnospiraceae bacterium]
MMNGVINIYKERGYTSQDVVAKLRGILKQKKIGHTGTLDPDAEGVLPICVGNATKLFDILTDRTKEYETVLLLGKTTDTQDVSGKILSENDSYKSLSDEIVKETINSFIPGYDQIPPMYSALKVNGKKLYELAREGKEVVRQPRRVDIDKIDITDISLPRITMKLSVSKGTYIRTICEDIGNKLGCGGCMESLLRTRAGSFSLDTALKLSEVEKIRDDGQLDDIIKKVDELFDYPSLHMREENDKIVHNGNIFLAKDTIENTVIDGNALVYDSTGIFVGIYTYVKSERKYKPFKMFL